MNIIQKLEESIGGRWLGVSVYAMPVACKENYFCSGVDRFCEALNIALVKEVLINPSQLTCYGARYAFGCDDDLKEVMARRIADTKGYSPASADQLIDRTPHFEGAIQAIGINVSDSPNLLVARLQPVQVMRIMAIYERKLEKPFRTEISSVMCACGNVTVRAILTQDMAISFGCDDSRKHGRVSRDRLYVGIPLAQAKTLMREEPRADQRPGQGDRLQEGI